MHNDHVRLSELIELRYGRGLPERKRQPGPYAVYGSNGIVGHHDSFLVDRQTIVVGRKGSVGEITLTETHSWPIDTTYYVVIKDESRLDLIYLFYYLKTLNLKRLDTSSAVPGINRKYVLDLSIPLTSLENQRKTADVLLKTDAIRQRREQANQLAGKIVQSVFLKMFGHPIVNPRGWPHRKIGEVSHVVRGSSPRPKGDPRYFGGPVPRLMIADITRDGTPVYPQIDSLTDEGARRSRPVKKGTLVIAVSGNVGLTSIVGVDCCIHDGFVALLNLDKSINPLFLNTYLDFMRQTNLARSSGAIWRNLTTHEIRDINVFAPPVELQDHFADIVESIQEIRRSQANSRQEIDELFHSLMHRAFRGELAA